MSFGCKIIRYNLFENNEVKNIKGKKFLVKTLLNFNFNQTMNSWCVYEFFHNVLYIQFLDVKLRRPSQNQWPNQI